MSSRRRRRRPAGLRATSHEPDCACVKSPCCEVDDQLVVDRRLHRQVDRFGAARNAVDVGCRLKNAVDPVGRRTARYPSMTLRLTGSEPSSAVRLRLGSLKRLMADLRDQGIVTKVRTLKTGKTVGGIPVHARTARPPAPQPVPDLRVVVGDSSGIFFTQRPHQPACSSSSARLTTGHPIRSPWWGGI